MTRPGAARSVPAAVTSRHMHESGTRKADQFAAGMDAAPQRCGADPVLPRHERGPFPPRRSSRRPHGRGCGRNARWCRCGGAADEAAELERYAESIRGRATIYHLTKWQLVCASVVLALFAGGGAFLIYRDTERGALFSIGIGLVGLAMIGALVIYLMHAETD